MRKRSTPRAGLALVLGLSVCAGLLSACGPNPPAHPGLCCQSRYGQGQENDPRLTYCLDHRSIVGQWLDGATNPDGSSPPDGLSAFTAVFNGALQSCQDTSCVQSALGASSLPGLQGFYDTEHGEAESDPSIVAAGFDDATKTDLIQCGFQTEIQRRSGGGS